MILMIIFSAVYLVGIPRALGYYNTPALTGQIYDSSSICNGQLVSNYGGSTQYDRAQGLPFSANPVLYTAVEGHSIHDCGSKTAVWVQNLHITLSAVDPSGNAMNGNVFGFFSNGLQKSLGSTSDTYQPILNFVYGYLVNLLPLGAGYALSYGLGSSELTSGSTTSYAWADWTPPLVVLFYPRDAGMYLSWQFNVDATKLGTYTVSIVYHQETASHDQKTGSTILNKVDFSQQWTYCFVVCSPLRAPSGPTSVYQGGSPLTLRAPPAVIN